MGGANLVWVEQIWSEWSKFGVGGVDVGRTNLENKFGEDVAV